MNRTDEQYVVLAASEMLDAALADLKASYDSLPMEGKLSVVLSIARVKGVASYLREAANIIGKTQP